MLKFVVDMMGNDLGLKPMIEAINEYSINNSDVEFYCVGNKNELSSLVEKDNIHVINSTSIISMDESPLAAIKKKDSSMIMAFNLFKEMKADAIISCGGTGAYLTGATLLIGRIKGIKRPALVAPFPTKIKSKFVTILDVGANSVCSVEELHQFALMGKVYSSAVFSNKNPRISLLSNGSEDHKGTPLIQEVNDVLKQDNNLNFIGNIEARYVLDGESDVVVCDGFSGNVLLKSTEGVFLTMNNLLKEGFKSSLITKIGYLFSKRVINNLRTTFDYKATGGAMLLGVDGVVVKAHGNSDKQSMLGAFNVAKRMVINKVIEKIKDELVINE